MARRRLQAVLALVGLHSAGVGVGLVLHPAALMERAGFAPLGEPFFAVQGGAFHLIMAGAYLAAARDPRGRRQLVDLAVLVKLAATVFLATYWLLAARVPAVLLSGLVDGAMAVVIFAAQRAARGEADAAARAEGA